MTCLEKEGVCLLRADYGGGLDWLQWTIFPQGQLLLDYRYSLEGSYDYFGVTFDLPEDAIKAMRWFAVQAS